MPDDLIPIPPLDETPFSYEPLPTTPLVPHIPCEDLFL